MAKAARKATIASAKATKHQAGKPVDIDGYIAQFPPDVQAVLEKVRATIRRAAPDAAEVISYQVPAFRQHGILVFFAAWKHHLGFYPPISGDPGLESMLARYAGPKGNLQFPLDEPIPYKLIERIVKLRVRQDAEKAAAKKKPMTPKKKSPQKKLPKKPLKKKPQEMPPSSKAKEIQ